MISEMNGNAKHPQQPTALRCLIIEDNLPAAEIMTIFFQRNGILCETAENGQIGLQMYWQDPSRYDVVFMDLQMPVMDGYEVAKQIRSSQTPTALTIPLVAMSGTNTGDVVGRGGFNYFLKKPFELRCLLNVLDELLPN